MCSWCWGFRPVWSQIQSAFLALDNRCSVEYVLGGLAPDSDEPMPVDVQQYVKANWQTIQNKIPNTAFNYDFWDKVQARRSTYPSCRAVIVAAEHGQHYEEAMILAIQQAYYLQAKNPSNLDVLTECAVSIGLDEAQFVREIQSEATEQLLQQHMALYQKLSFDVGIAGFPSLVLSLGDSHGAASSVQAIAVPIDYNNHHVSLDMIRAQISSFSS